jgi:peptide/nickel transport system ATP-binding protein
VTCGEESQPATRPPPPPLLRVRGLETHFYTARGTGKAVDGVSFTLGAGRTLGLVGESGSGKSITAASLIQLNPRPASRIVAGEVLFNGTDLLKLNSSQIRSIRGRHIGYVPQEPLSALDPLFRVANQIGEPLRTHLRMRRSAVSERVIELLTQMGVPMPYERSRAFPHELSGGMRQRVLSAIALACRPDLLIADEPTTALDVTVQADYLNLLRDLQRDERVAILFITHDFGIVANLCHEVAVMYCGTIVEQTSTETLFVAPAHPYTRALLSALPDPDKPGRRLAGIEGQPPSIFDRPQGCAFAPRCPLAMDKCREAMPPYVQLSDGHGVACWRAM